MKATGALWILVAACGGSSAPTSGASTTPTGGSVLAAPAGGDAAAPTCAQVTAHIRDLAVTASGAKTEAQKTETLRDIEPAIAEITDECETSATAWSPAFRRCVLAAADHDAVKVCDAAHAGERSPTAAPEGM